ncbi:50S ribosomal protein L29 [Helicobacter monodelphidis]|uniref:50S ribosomal protein L29 n=1 Tax=Helicobacter sp. 15-1451 TaxID=2004995 RepID=UPI000DCD05DE|nr:50S ribosomal protein L29 [Helicobacter sp. 15-1451]RAX57111.1 50S ribosomal protein L29 [Helicobacter sp. 15-1451]
MKFTELKDQSKEALLKLLKEKRMSLFELKLKLKTTQLRNSNEIRMTRRDIARIQTALSDIAIREVSNEQ